MKKFEYRITKHPAESFVQLVYFCSAEGKCQLEQVPKDQVQVLEHILNENGSEGWELIQAFFGEGGIVAFWKREI